MSEERKDPWAGWTVTVGLDDLCATVALAQYVLRGLSPGTYDRFDEASAAVARLDALGAAEALRLSREKRDV